MVLYMNPHNDLLAKLDRWQFEVETTAFRSEHRSRHARIAMTPEAKS